MSEAAEVLFYHLERAPLERVLPSLLERTLERGWRAVVQSGSAERLEALDLALWTYNDESFLPHGTARDGDPARQPIYLTLGDDEARALAGQANRAALRRSTGHGVGDRRGRHDLDAAGAAGHVGDRSYHPERERKP